VNVDEKPPYDDSCDLILESEPKVPLQETATHDTGPPTSGFDLKLYFMLLAASLVGTLAILPYSYTLIKQMKTPLPDFVVPIALAVTVVLELGLSAAMIGIGLGLGPQLQMGRLFHTDSSSDEMSKSRRLWVWFGKPLVFGIALGGIIVLALWKVEVSGVNDRPINMPDAWEGLLASIGAGIREEIWLRLGLLTFLVWLSVVVIRRFTGQQPKSPAPVFWVANLIAAISFAAIHIPQTQMLMGLTIPLLVFVLMGNGVPGLVFGWLYWRRGLVAAMVAHFGLDLVLKVFVPLLS
jgi:Type II CAAX prenyl endopeptidase Rce1-like